MNYTSQAISVEMRNFRDNKALFVKTASLYYSLLHTTVVMCTKSLEQIICEANKKQVQYCKIKLACDLEISMFSNKAVSLYLMMISTFAL